MKPRKPRKPTHGFQYTFQHQGKRYYKTVKSRKAGEAWVRKEKGKLERGEVGLLTGGTLNEAIKAFNKLRKPELSQSTQDAYEIYFRKHITQQLGARQLATLTASDVRDWMTERREDGLSAATVKRLFELLRAVLMVATQRSMVAKNVCSEVKLKKGVSVREVRMLENDEIQALLMACKAERSRTMVIVGLNTGMRLGEMMAMKWEWINWRRAVIRVPASLESGFVPKGKEEREIPLLQDARVALMKWMGKGKGEGVVFPGINWRRWARALRKRAGKHLAKLRDPKNPAPVPIDFPFRWHLLRHTYVSNLLIMGVAPRVVQAAAGWASIRMLERYSHLAPDAWGAITARFPQGVGHGTDQGTKPKGPKKGS